MNYNVLPTHKFERAIKRLIKKFPSLKNEYASLIAALKTNPTTGTPLGNDCYKIRLAIASKNKGKSGGARVITYVVIEDIAVFLLTIYDKSEQDNISDKELKAMIEGLE
ncbi:type II toxin-antitoxin system RelE/ParE family toxin [Ferruginibacter sp.]|uniref:type II toxin-antitoxin system RelE/ParE family toxin n=1 Tax=Ferruginibacter sp. TaxID=1940288 RepID=UPI0026598D2B|nr:type II toxin-antitoxin system RelE/ParE family toxin [Ferruginibacter sp.]